MPGTKSRYIPALDGLRAFAVLAVIAYHMGMPWAPGGLLGVTVFFVLSGYLITSLLLIEWDNTGRINLPQFWLRRVRRLFPAIVLVIVCTAALCTVFDHSLLTKLREDMWAALLLGDELVVHPARRLLLRRARRAVAAHALLVARHRGAVLPDLAARAVRGPQAGGQAHHHAQRHAGGRPAVGAGDGAALQPARRPEPRVLRHRHARVLAAHRRMAGVRVALAPAGRRKERAADEAGAHRPRRGGPGRAPRAARPHRAGGRLLAVPVPRRHAARLYPHRRRHRRHGAPGQPARAHRGREAARVGGSALLRHLPVALPAASAHEPAQLHGRDALVDVPRAGGGHLRLRRVLVPLRGESLCARAPSAPS